MRRHLLVVAYHYPPIQESSGIHRTLAFTRYLAEHGWDMTVLSVALRAYHSVREENLAMIPPHVRVERAFALDTQRHLSIGGRYLGFMAMPDRWQSWILGGYLAGRRLIRERRPDAVFTTYPIASAHAIGWLLSRWSGIPWVADFRDPMAQHDWPPDRRLRRVYWWLEKKVAARAAALVTTTPGAAETYRARYPHLPASRVRRIENGFDEQLFSGVEAPPRQGARRTLLHSGLLVSAGRDPGPFLVALARLRERGTVTSAGWRVVFRATGHDDTCRRLVSEHGVDNLVEILPSVPYHEALREMLGADGLLVFQSATCNHQIPAKVYEYLYASRPVMGVVDPQGDTGGLLARMGVTAIGALEDVDAITDALARFVRAVEAGTAPVAPRNEVTRLSRRARTAELAELLEEVVA